MSRLRFSSWTATGAAIDCFASQPAVCRGLARDSDRRPAKHRESWIRCEACTESGPVGSVVESNATQCESNECSRQAEPTIDIWCCEAADCASVWSKTDDEFLFPLFERIEVHQSQLLNRRFLWRSMLCELFRLRGSHGFRNEWHCD